MKADAITASPRRRKSDSWANDFFFGASFMCLGAILYHVILEVTR